MIISFYIKLIGVVLMKLINKKGTTVLEADNKQHLIAELLVFFECNDFTVDFDTGNATIAGVECEVIDDD